MKKKKRLSDKHEAFCLELVKDWNGTQAYHRAYKNNNLVTCASNAEKLLRKTEINERIAELKEQRNQESMVDIKYVVDKAKFIISTDFTELIELGVKGATREQFDAIPKEIRSLVTQVKFTTNTYRPYKGSEAETEIEKITFKLMSKDKALEILAKHTGTFSDATTNVNIGIGSLSEMLKDAEEKEGKL